MSSLRGRDRAGRPDHGLPGLRDGASSGVLEGSRSLRLVHLRPPRRAVTRAGVVRAGLDDHPGGARPRGAARPGRSAACRCTRAGRHSFRRGRRPPTGVSRPGDRLLRLRPGRHSPLWRHHGTGRHLAGGPCARRDPSDRPARAGAGARGPAAGHRRRRRLGHLLGRRCSRPAQPAICTFASCRPTCR